MATAKVKLPKFRIGLAAVGRRLSSIMLRANSGELSQEDFYDTINAVFNSCVEEDCTPEPDANVDREILAAEKAEIEKSVRRSQAARIAAERRRQKSISVAVPSDDRSDNLPADSAPAMEGGAARQGSGGFPSITTPTVEEETSSTDETDEPEEIFAPKYDAYGVRRRWY